MYFKYFNTLDIIHTIVVEFGSVTCLTGGNHTLPGEGYVAFYATPNPILLNKICLNQQILIDLYRQ